VTLYGYAREPDSPDADGEPPPPPPVPVQRAASAPVPVATPTPTSDVFGAPPTTPDPVLPDPWAPPPPPPLLAEMTRTAEPPVDEPDLGQPDPPPAGVADGVPAPLWREPIRPASISHPQREEYGFTEPGSARHPSPNPESGGFPAITTTGTGGATAGEPTELPVGQAPHDWAASVPDLDDADEIVPWDRRPLMVVIAGAVALVLLAIVSGVATVQIFGTDKPPAAWREVQVPSTDGPAATTPAPVLGGGGGGAITLSGVGDVIMGSEPDDVPPNGGAGIFGPVKSALAADVVMGNLETPLTADTGRVKCPLSTPTPVAGNPSPTPTPAADCFQFHLPPSYANNLHDAGFTVMNLANNHTNDMGPEGLSNTRKALVAASVQHTGAPNEITYVDAKGLKVAVLGFSIYSWGQNLNNIPAAVDLVRKADAKADLVVIQMQGGAEGADKAHVHPGKEIFLGEDRGDLVKFSHAVIDAGADVVFGHGPHVMRGMEFYKGRLIAYSLGNFCGYGVLSTTGFLGVSGVLKVNLNKDGSWASGQLVPTEMSKSGLPVPDPQKRALAFVNGLSKDDFGAAAATISTTDGAISAPAP
jgi:hypothetical protein